MVGTFAARGPALVRRLLTAVLGTAVVVGLVAGLMPWGLTWQWLAATCGLVLVSAFAAGLRRDLRAVGRLWISPTRTLVLSGTWTSREVEAHDVVAVQTWCNCGGGSRVAPHRDGLEVLLRGGRAVRVDSGTVLPADVAMTLGELLAPAGIKVVDWGETSAFVS